MAGCKMGLYLFDQINICHDLRCVSGELIWLKLPEFIFAGLKIVPFLLYISVLHHASQ